MRWLVAIVVLGSTAGAEPRFEVGAGTAAPLYVGAEATVHATHRLSFDLAVGWMPPPYVDTINAVAIALDGYGDTEAALIEAALDDSLIVRIGGGYRPFSFPLSFHAGYSLAALGGSLSSAEAIEAVTGEQARGDFGPEIPMHSTLHLFQVGAAWRFTLRPNLVLRVALEYTQPFSSSTGIDSEPRTPAAMQRKARVNAALDAYMTDIYSSYVKAPVLGVSLRWRGS